MNERPRAERRRFGELKATEPGAESAGRYFLDYFNHKARVLTEPEAGESSLKGGRRRPPGPASRHPRLLPRRPGPGRRPPLTLSGLALARANRGLEGQLGPDGQDGILYALEAQDLNLEGTRLVTLSACDTGRGAVDRSEGVCGLVCAFPIAGAQGVLMSLWPLDDALAAEFMGDFYRRWALRRPPQRRGGGPARRPPGVHRLARPAPPRPGLVGALGAGGAALEAGTRTIRGGRVAPGRVGARQHRWPWIDS